MKRSTYLLLLLLTLSLLLLSVDAILPDFRHTTIKKSAEAILDEKIAHLDERLSKLEKETDKIQDLLLTLSRQKAQESRDSDALKHRSYALDEAHDDDPFMGRKDADLMLVVFSAYFCKTCRDFYSRSFIRLRKKYSDRALIVFRDFPLNSPSLLAANYAHCAGEQGNYWKLHDFLFNASLKNFEQEALSLLKEGTDFDEDRFSHCVRSRRYDSEIALDLQRAKDLGARGAPGLFVGIRKGQFLYEGIFLRGAQPYELIEGIVERMLKR